MATVVVFHDCGPGCGKMKVGVLQCRWWMTQRESQVAGSWGEEGAGPEAGKEARGALRVSLLFFL